jgi:putative hydrolase of the HAD superfamily
MEPMIIKTIVFDFGNVIGFFDHYRTLDRIACYTDMTPAAMYAAIYDSELEDDFERGRISQAEFLRRFRRLCRLSCDNEVLAVACADIFRPNADVCAMLPALKTHHRLLLGSNTNELHARHFLQQFADVLRHFDGIVLSYEIGVRKPLPEFFHHCQHLAGCAAGECLFIDDLPANVAGARACGWQGIVYRSAEELRQRLHELGVRL